MGDFYGYYYDPAKDHNHSSSKIYCNAQYICAVTDIRSSSHIEELMKCQTETEQLLFILSDEIKNKLDHSGPLSEVI